MQSVVSRIVNGDRIIWWKASPHRSDAIVSGSRSIPGNSQVIRFATFEVDLQARELRKSGLRLKLAGQPFHVLAILFEHPDQVVTREELQKQLWPDTFVDVDHNLNTAINKIREALGDSSENPRFVETLPPACACLWPDNWNSPCLEFARYHRSIFFTRC